MSKGSFAQGVLFGRLGKDPEKHTGNSGKSVVTVSIATTSGYGNNETTSWWTVKIFDERKGKVASDFLKKGSRVLVSGELVIRKWTNRDRQDVYSPELHVGFEGSITLVDKAEDSGGSSGGGYQQRQDNHRSRPQPASFEEELDDDVPF